MTPDKTCSRCGKTKMALAFARNRSSKDGLRGECRDCTSEKNEAYRARVLSKEAEEAGVPDYVYAKNIAHTIGAWKDVHRSTPDLKSPSQDVDNTTSLEVDTDHVA